MGPGDDPLPGCTVNQAKTTSATAQDLSLELLRVSRQIYHEAVLKPFSESRFHYASRDGTRIDTLRKFLDAFTPTQAKAIAHLRLVIECSYDWSAHTGRKHLKLAPMPGKLAINMLKGLHDLEIVAVPFFTAELPASRFIKEFDPNVLGEPCMQELHKMRIRSLRLTMAAENDTEEIETWLQKAEIGLQFGLDAKSGVKPLPSDDWIVPSDNTRGVPSEAERKEYMKQCEEAYERYVAEGSRRAAQGRANEPPLVTVAPGVQVQGIGIAHVNVIEDTGRAAQERVNISNGSLVTLAPGIQVQTNESGGMNIYTGQNWT